MSGAPSTDRNRVCTLHLQFRSHARGLETTGTFTPHFLSASSNSTNFSSTCRVASSLHSPGVDCPGVPPGRCTLYHTPTVHTEVTRGQPRRTPQPTHLHKTSRIPQSCLQKDGLPRDPGLCVPDRKQRLENVVFQPLHCQISCNVLQQLVGLFQGVCYIEAGTSTTGPTTREHHKARKL